MSSGMWGRQLRSALAMALLVLVFLVVGEIAAGVNGMVIAFITALVMNMIIYWFSDKIALAAHGAKPISPMEAPDLYRIVESLTAEDGIPTPAIYQIPTDSPNAFATGRDPNHASVAVTQGALKLLDERELRAVLSHEISHVKHRDILITTMAAVISGAIFTLVRWMTWFGGGRRSRSDSGGLQLIALLVLIIVAPIAVLFLQAMLSQSREYMADEGGARLSHDPLALASALRKLDQWSRRIPMTASPAYSSLYIVHAAFGNFGSWFSTHPPIADRIARLEEMARSGSHLH